MELTKPFFIEHIDSGLVLAACDHGQFKSFIKRSPDSMFKGFCEVELSDFPLDRDAYILIAHTEWDHEYKFYAENIRRLPALLALLPSSWMPLIVIEPAALLKLTKVC